MKTQSERINLGRKIVENKQAKITTSHSIISKNKLPFLFADEIEKYKEQYGHHLMAYYLDHNIKIATTRDEIFHIASKIIPHALSITALVVTEFGLGECHESATLAMYHLLKAKQENIAILMIESNPYSDTKKIYGHVFVLLVVTADMFPKAVNDIRVLNDLPDEVIAIDPFLNKVLPANQYLLTEATYLNLFQYQKIAEIFFYQSMTESQLLKQDRLIHKIKQKCLEAGIKEYQANEL